MFQAWNLLLPIPDKSLSSFVRNTTLLSWLIIPLCWFQGAVISNYSLSCQSLASSLYSYPTVFRVHCIWFHADHQVDHSVAIKCKFFQTTILNVGWKDSWVKHASSYPSLTYHTTTQLVRTMKKSLYLCGYPDITHKYSCLAWVMNANIR
jgi:hypothetical protein